LRTVERVGFVLSQEQYSPPAMQRPRPLLQLPWIVVSLGLAAALMASVRTGAGLRLPIGPVGPDTRLLQGDLRYRAGLTLEALRRVADVDVRVDPDDLLQSGIGQYERLALRRERPDAGAMYRLAVIYARAGYAPQALELLGRLVQIDERNAPLYLCVSCVYDPDLQTPDELRKAQQTLLSRGDWPARLALSDLYRRLDDMPRAHATERWATVADLRFGALIALMAVAYGYLLTQGSVVLAIALWRWLFRRATDARRSLPLPPWSALDGSLVALILAVVVVAATWLGAIALRRAGPGALSYPVPALWLVGSYLLSTGLALAAMRWRMGRLARPLDALGLRGPLSLRALRQGVWGYGVAVALFALVALAVGDDLSGLLPAQVGARGLQTVNLTLYFALTVLVAPLVEEVLFRGFLFAGLRQSLNLPAAALLSSMVFGAAHLGLAVWSMAAVAVMGAFFAYLYERTGSLWPPVVAHTLHNLLAFVVVLAVGM
jgi:membrane protease YdiL (CAAX protease family)